MKRYSTCLNVQARPILGRRCSSLNVARPPPVNVPRGNVEVLGGWMLPWNRKGAVTSAVGPSSGGATASPVNTTPGIR